MSKLIPPINSKGIFRVKPPLDTLIKQNIEYQVTNIRTIRDMVDDDIDVLNGLYIAEGLTKDQYLTDLANNEIIITLVAPNGAYYYIPANMIISIPDISGVKYVEKTIGINLGALPKNIEIDFIKDEISELIKDRLGIIPKIVIVDTSEEYIFTYEESETKEKTRKANIGNSLSLQARYNKLLTAYNELRNRIKLLLTRLTNLEQAVENCNNGTTG